MMFMHKVTVPTPTETKMYLWIPVSLSGEVKRLRIIAGDGTIWQEIWMRFENVDWYVPLDVSAFAGDSLSFEAEAPSQWFAALRFSSRLPEREHCQRPQLHFTADRGWNNDPNGLVFCNGVWHMFFQYNPYGTDWNNMQWGHAVSRDLIVWRQMDIALFPDETGTMYSGSAVTDREGALGFGKNALAFFYTAAGGKNDWSVGKPFTQRVAVLRPDPEAPELNGTMEKTGIVALEHIVDENRDPKVFWHEPSAAYIMVLYLNEWNFAIFRSSDLGNWTLSQKLTLEKCWECPDLFCLPVEGSDQYRWVFWSADGYYFVGTFDGYQFVPETERLCAYAETGSRIPYAAQTFSGLEGRTISVSWLRLPNRQKPYTGAMSIPCELSLARTEKGLRLRMPYVRELEQYRRELTRYTNFKQPIFLPDNGNAWMLSIDAEGEFDAEIPFGTVVFKDNVLTFSGSSFELSKEKRQRLAFLADGEVLELHAANDTICATWEVQPQNGGKVQIHPRLSGTVEAVLSVFDVPER